MKQHHVFSFLQRMGKSFMLPIAVLPVAGIFLGVGSSLTNETTIASLHLGSVLGNGTFLYSVLILLKQVGKILFDNLPLIFAVSIAVYKENLIPVFLSLVYTYTTTKTCDFIMYGAKSALKFEVITEHAEEISKEIIEKLGHAVTVTPAEGMFEHKNKVLLICVIKPRQTAKFQEIISRYPETFAYVGTVSEVIGKFNSTGRKEKKNSR